jgi:integrase
MSSSTASVPNATRTPFRRRPLRSGTTPTAARRRTKIALGQVAAGRDPALERAKAREAEAAKQIKPMTIEELGKLFLDEAITPRRKPATASSYETLLRVHFYPQFDKRPAVELTRIEIRAHHARMKNQRTTANRVLAVVGSMYSFAARQGIVPEGFNPSRGIEKYKEQGRERYLKDHELKRLGQTLIDAETVGIPWVLNALTTKAKHRPLLTRSLVDRHAVAALRLLIFTGARLREILNLRWERVDLDRGLLLLLDSKTGKKTIVLKSC